MRNVSSKKVKEPVRLRSKKLANGNLSLYLDIYRGGKRVYEFLKMYLIPEKTKNDKVQNEETLRTANAIKAQRIISLQNEEFGFQTSVKAKANFIQYLEKQAESYDKKGSLSHAKILRFTIDKLIQYKGQNITLKQVDKAYLRGFIDYLNMIIGKRGKALSQASKSLYFNVVVIALNNAVRDGLITTNPAHLINSSDRPKQGTATKVYLTFDEVKTLSATPCKYEMIKRAFLFSCFCGLRFSDIKKLKWEDIHKLTGNRYQVEIKQQKTDEPLYLPLSANALKWLPEKGKSLDTDNVFSLPHVVTVEKYLKVWAANANIDKDISFHVSRHTNATLLLNYGVDLYTVSKLLGHTSVKTTQIYAKVVDENKRKAVNLIPEL